MEATAFAQAEVARLALVTAEGQLRAAGYLDAANVVRRALGEFLSPAYTGQVNTVGMNIYAVH